MPPEAIFVLSNHDDLVCVRLSLVDECHPVGASALRFDQLDLTWTNFGLTLSQILDFLLGRQADLEGL